ncbi:MAG: hypothetical protein FWF03_04625, partial [Defluviitaleaceae bacterium]|nr:hypothetical protein [Defluviitaleaceae bacterium]
MAKRHGTFNRIGKKIGGYWGGRIKAQLAYLEEINAADGEKHEKLLDEAVSLLGGHYDSDGTVTKSAALSIEGVIAEASPSAKRISVECVGHAHIDMNWMWRYDETVMITIDTVKTVLALMDEYPNFTFAQSQASVYRIIEEFAPELLPEIRRRISQKRWEVTAAAWVETDKNMPNGESLTRHLLYTRAYLKELLGLGDGDFLIDFEPDTFGHGANVPEILNSGGVKYYYHCRGHNKRALYRWRSPSGAEVVVFRDPTWYNDSITPETFLYVPSFCKANGLDRLLHVYGIGDHGGGPTRRDIERLIDYASWPCMPEIKFGRYADYFKYMEGLPLPTVEGELNFVFDGCYTTQTRIKKGNRRSEALLKESEALNAFAKINGAYPYDAKAFEGAWKNVLFNQFHDIIPGSGVIDTREHAMGLYQQAYAVAGSRASASARGLCRLIKTDGLFSGPNKDNESTAEGAGVGYGVEQMGYAASSPVDGDKRLFTLINPGQFEISKATELTVWDWAQDKSKLVITDEKGSVIPHELVDGDEIGYWGHKYFRLLVACAIPPFGYRTIALYEDARRTSGALSNAAPGVWDGRVDKAVPFVLENERIRAAFDPKNGDLTSYFDKKTGTEYIKAGCAASFKFINEDASKGMTAWIVGRHTDDGFDIKNVSMTEVKGTLRRSFSFTAKVYDSVIKTTVSLDSNSEALEYKTVCEWREPGVSGKVPQLSFCVPLSYQCREFVYDNAFGLVRRPGMDSDVPASSFAFAPNETGESG